MKRYYTSQQGAAWLLLLGAAVMMGIGAFTNHWSESMIAHRGLVKFCAFGDTSSLSSLGKLGQKVQGGLQILQKGLKMLNNGEDLCVNRFKDLFDQLEHSSEDSQTLKGLLNNNGFEAITLGLMSVAFGTTVFALLIAPCCCTRCNCCIHFFVILAVLADAAGLGIYAYHVKTDRQFLVDWSFGWSYWVSLGSLIALIVADVLFCVGASRPPAPPVANPPYEIMPMENA